MRFAALALSLLGACGDAPSPVSDAGAPLDATTRADATINADAATQADATTRADTGSTIDERGFAIRVPSTRSVPCTDRGNGECRTPMVMLRDADLVCTLRHGAYDRHFVYVQLDASALDGLSSFLPLPRYTVAGAFLSDGTSVISSGFMATYDFGGGHNNDSLSVELPTQTYRYYHSSFGFGFRKCQPMDCLQVFGPGGNTATEDGCMRDRTLPAVCVSVTDTGTVPPMVDGFMRCLGDS